MGDLNRSIKIFIDGTEAATGVDKVKQAIAGLEQKLASLNKSEANYEQRAADLKKQIENRNKTLQNYNKKLEETERVLKNLSGATYDELLAVRKVVQQELRSVVPGTEKHTRALEQNKRVTIALTQAQAAMRVEVGSQANIWSRGADFVNKYIGITTAFIASITGLSMTLRRSVDDYAQISEAMAGVKKYTGMTDEAVKDLNESLKEMDTRTARERLNELAQDAGRLGIQGKEGILEFVEAADIINVALGEDLGEDAVKNIGKLAQMFGDDKEMGLKGAMLATGSAINEVAQNSSAAEQYLVEFTAQVAGASKQAGIAQADLIGYASVLDQNMLRNEKAATAFQKVMMKMYQEPAKLAKLAGIDVNEFSEIVKNNANEALLTFFDALSKKGGLSDLAPIFKELKLQGEGAASVLSVMAGKVNDIRSAQELANEAYNEGTSVITEFNVQNNTVQAGLDKAKKKFQEIIYEMGEQLAPSMGKLITSTGQLIKLLASLVKFVAANSTAITAAGIAIAGYWTGVKLTNIVLKLAVAETSKLTLATIKQTIVEKASVLSTKANRAATLGLATAKLLLAGNIQKATQAMRLFNTVSKSNMIGLLISLGAALTYGLYKLATQTKKTQKEINDLTRQTELYDEITKQTNISMVEHRAQVELLLSAIHSENLSNDERREAIKKLQEIIPDYNAAISEEGRIIKENKTAIDEYIASMEKEIRVAAIKDKAKELITKKIEHEEKNSDVQQNLDKLNTENQYNVNQDPLYQRNKALLEGIMTFNKEQIDKIDSDLSFLYSKAVETTNKIVNGLTGGGGGGNDKETKKQYELKLKQQENAHNTSLNNLRLFKQKEGQIEAEFNLFQLGQEKQFYQERIKTLTNYLAQVAEPELKADVQKQIEDARSKLLETEEKYDNATLKSLQTCRDEMLKAVDDYNIQKKTTLEESLSNETITQEEYNSLILSLDSEHAQSRLLILKDYQAEVEKAELLSGGLKVKAIENANKEVIDADLKAAKARTKQAAYYAKIVPDFNSKFGLTNKKNETQLQLNALQVYYDSRVKLIKEAIKNEELTEVSGQKQLTELHASYLRAKQNITRKADRDAQRAQDRYGLLTVRSKYELELDELREANEKKLLLDEEYEKARFNLARDYAKERFDYFSDISNNAIMALQNVEIANMEAKYQAEIAAAQGNSEEIERLETEKAQKKLDIEKKYADVNFAIKASQIIADTSVSIMKAFAELGPIAGAVAAVALGVTGVAQLALANAERQKVKSMTLSGSSSSQSDTAERIITPQRASGNYDVIGEEDGKTYRNIPFIGEAPTGIVRRTALISESGSELIVNAQDLVRLQRHINYPLVLSAINDARANRVPQRKDGNYDSIKTTTSGTSSDNTNQDTTELKKEIKLLIRAMKELKIRAYVVLSDITNAQDLKDKSEKPFTKGD